MSCTLLVLRYTRHKGWWNHVVSSTPCGLRRKTVCKDFRDRPGPVPGS